MTEQLTEEERERLNQKGERKALRIIDAHAADRAALVARVEAAEAALDRRNAECEDAEIRLREQTSRAELAEGRLQALGYIAERDRAERAESEAAALRAELSEAERLREAEAKANKQLRAEAEAANKACDLASGSRDAALAEVERLRKRADQVDEGRRSYAAQLAAANALLDRIQQWERAQQHELAGEPWVCLMNDLDAHLSAQPTAPNLDVLPKGWHAAQALWDAKPEDC